MFIFMSLCIIICAYVVFKILIAWHPDSGKSIKSSQCRINLIFAFFTTLSIVSKLFSSVQTTVARPNQVITSKEEFIIGVSDPPPSYDQVCGINETHHVWIYDQKEVPPKNDQSETGLVSKWSGKNQTLLKNAAY